MRSDLEGLDREVVTSEAVNELTRAGVAIRGSTSFGSRRSRGRTPITATRDASPVRGRGRRRVAAARTDTASSGGIYREVLTCSM